MMPADEPGRVRKHAWKFFLLLMLATALAPLLGGLATKVVLDLRGEPSSSWNDIVKMMSFLITIACGLAVFAVLPGLLIRLVLVRQARPGAWQLDARGRRLFETTLLATHSTVLFVVYFLLFRSLEAAGMVTLLYGWLIVLAAIVAGLCVATVLVRVRSARHPTTVSDPNAMKTPQKQ